MRRALLSARTACAFTFATWNERGNPVTLDEGDVSFLLGELTVGAVLGLAADIGFMEINCFRLARKRTFGRRIRSFECYVQEPSRLGGYAERTV